MLCKRILKALPVALLAVVVMCSVSFAGTAGADTAGTVHFERFTESTFDQYLENPSPTIQSWLNTHIWRMGTYTPYFNGMTSWYPNAWMYKDSYALYTDESIATQHPEWVLRDASGNPLYIPWGCSNGTCPQYAGNIANQAFRQWWISNAKTELSSASYRGLFVDDVNMEMRVGNGHEEAVAPIDPATGQPMTATAWRAYMAQFMQEIRADLPNYEIVQNAIWYSDGDAGTSDASIRNQISASNYVYLERGVNDSGITGGSGQWSLNALFSFIDQVHALGKGVVLDGTSSSIPAMEYNLASYFLVSSGNDGVSGAGQTPENWWAGWNVNLGEATGPRYTWDNLLRRDFAGGMVLVNPPGATYHDSLPPHPDAERQRRTRHVRRAFPPPQARSLWVSPKQRRRQRLSRQPRHQRKQPWKQNRSAAVPPHLARRRLALKARAVLERQRELYTDERSTTSTPQSIHHPTILSRSAS